MRAEAERFSGDMASGKMARWLSFLGGSGTGKTFLGTMIKAAARMTPGMSWHESLIDPILTAFWPKLFSQLRNGDFWRINDLEDANFVLLDEVTIDHDASGFGRDKLCELLTRRVGKWTVVTSNLGIDEISGIDHRIASRMIRGGSVVVDCSTMDFNLRPTP